MSGELRIAMIGAGDVNFGGGEGPWDHATRLEKLGGMVLVGVADPNTERAQARLAARSGAMVAGTRVYADYRRMLSELKPDAVWIGVPPNAHGTAEPGMDIELACAEAGVHMLVEKPLSCARPERVREVARRVASSSLITSVGYMFRYARAVEAMKRIIDDTPGGAKAFVARYDCAYSEIRKSEWWDVRTCGGPIVEQATHFVDLGRYLVGDVDLQSVRAVAIHGSDPVGQLVDLPLLVDGSRCGDAVPAEFKTSRVTSAVWRFCNGAVGSLTHATLLHRKKYDTELEVWGDGLRVVLQDPYGDCRVLVRRPHSEAVEQLTFIEDDPYLAENRAFVEAIRTGDASGIRSSYADAMKTFELTWAITDAAI